MREGVLAFLAASAAFVGLWAGLAPTSFAHDFGVAQAWMGADGPFNEHLVRDVGQLNLALAAPALLLLDERGRPRAAAGRPRGRAPGEGAT